MGTPSDSGEDKLKLHSCMVQKKDGRAIRLKLWDHDVTYSTRSVRSCNSCVVSLGSWTGDIHTIVSVAYLLASVDDGLKHRQGPIFRIGIPRVM